MRTRAGIILLKENKLALIERHRQGRHYFAFPGGGVDEGETPEQAAIREAEEELGIQVKIVKLIAEVTFNMNAQYYFLVEWVGGEFGTGTGEEYEGFDPKHGTYLPLWMPLTEVPTQNVLPRELAELIVQSECEGWPDEAVRIYET